MVCLYLRCFLSDASDAAARASLFASEIGGLSLLMWSSDLLGAGFADLAGVANGLDMRRRCCRPRLCSPCLPLDVEESVYEGDTLCLLPYSLSLDDCPLYSQLYAMRYPAPHQLLPRAPSDLGRDLYVSGERRAAIWRAESRNSVKIVKNLY